MTFRAIILGLLGVVTVCGITYYNDAVLHNTMFIGNSLPIVVYGGLICFVLLLNPLLRLLRTRIAFTGAELAVALAMTLTACCIPASGLLRTFSGTLIHPHQMAQTRPGWQGTPLQLRAIDILDWSKLCDVLKAPSGTLTERFAGTLPEEDRIDAARDAAAADAREEVLAALNGSLARSDLFTLEELPNLPVAAHLHKALQRRGDEIVFLNAKIIEVDADHASQLESLAARVAEAKAELASMPKSLPAQTVEGALPEEQPALSPQEARRKHLQDALDVLKSRLEKLPGVAKERHDRLVAALRLEWMRVNRILLDSALPDIVKTRTPDILESVASRMLADVRMDENAAMAGFVRGLRVGDTAISAEEVPWWAWTRTLSFWLPLIVSLWIALIAINVVVYRQWAHHEQLPYPVAVFAESMLPGKAGEKSSMFASPLFWLGGGVVFAIHLNNYICSWYPGWIAVPLDFPLWSLKELFPTLEAGGGGFAFQPHIYFTVIAIAYFLASDVSLSLGVGPFVYAWVIGTLAAYGITKGGGGYIEAKPEAFLNFGAFLGLFLVFMYTGRQYYRAVFCRAVLLPSREKVSANAVWAARIFILAIGLFVGQLTLVGLDWQIALLYAAGLVMILLVMGRIVAETGLFFIQPYTFPCAFLVGIFGARAIGPEAVVILAMVSLVLIVDPREAITPFVVNSLRLADRCGVKIGRTALLCGLAILLGLGVAVPVTLYQQYDRGTDMSDSWAVAHVPRFAFEEGIRVRRQLEGQDSLAASQALSGWERVAAFTPDRSCLPWFAVGLVLVLAFTAGRLRFASWPLHPVMFLIWTSMPGKIFAWSFLIGWTVKVMVTKYGGSGLYQKLKPLMLGLIAGELLGGFTPALFNILYALITGSQAAAFSIMPR